MTPCRLLVAAPVGLSMLTVRRVLAVAALAVSSHSLKALDPVVQVQLACVEVTAGRHLQAVPEAPVAGV